MWEKHEISMCHGYVKYLLKKHGYCKRKLYKNLPIGEYARRNQQFEIIFMLVGIVSRSNGPILSIDTKKKERLGNLYRAGSYYSNTTIEVLDHDFEYLSEGKVIPHGIYDLKSNQGFISIGTNYETAEFLCDNLLWWWENFGIHNYPTCKHIMLLCDSGGANSYRHHAFKKELQRLAAHIGVRIIVCHYPPYSSKWNPIEHRLFPHVHRAMQGVVFASYEIVKELIEKTWTKTGLSVVARIVRKLYKKGIKCSKDEVDQKRIFYHPDLPELSYSILP